MMVSQEISNQEKQKRARSKVILYVILVAIFSSVFYYLIIASQSLETWVLPLMWSPAVAGLIALLVYDRSIRGVGWRPGKVKYLVAGAAIPLIYWLVIYAVIWIFGWGEFVGFSDFTSLFKLAISGILISIFLALGEEIGWRGVLVPNLSKFTTFTLTAVISGAIWGLWHYPLIVTRLYAANTNIIYQLLCFSVGIIGVATMLAWFRLRSGSVWPAVLFHAVHNTLIDSVFQNATFDTDITPYIGTEFGIGLALTGIVLFLIFWTRRAAVEGDQTAPGKLESAAQTA
jgi:membrane protease YdiL (CAAX protease family)